MRLPRIFPIYVLVAAVIAFVAWRAAPQRDRAAFPREPVPPTAADARQPTFTTATLTAEARRQILERYAYAQAWTDAAQPESFGAFRAWTDRYRAAPAAARGALVEEGVSLARSRRVALLDLIRSDPQRALAVTVPAAVRRDLPPEVAVELERRVAGKGEFALMASSPSPDDPAAGPRIRRVALIGGVSYTAHIYGRREPQTALAAASLHGIALDREIALHESPLRAMESGETTAGASNATCPVSDLPVAATPPDVTIGNDSLAYAEFEARVVEYCDTSGDMIERHAQLLIAAEDGSTRRTVDTPVTAAEAATAWTLGTKEVLVIRVDFSDFPGEPMSVAAAQNVMNNGVRPLFEDMSYGKTSINGTISEAVYRMPQTGSSYALADNENQMHTDARNAAAANYTLAQFDRIIVLFPNLGTSRVPGSLITFGGEALVNAANVWINGSASFTTATVSHELGHTYGLMHSNLWRINDGNPVSPNGNTLEYGDPFDTMGSSGTTGVTRDARHHFNQWHKNRLGWLPDAAVTTVKTSGTYRIYRFDSRDAALTQPLALRIFRDGVRWYWVGLRQNFATGTPTANGAHVIWGYNNRQQSELLDLTTPGVNANDATLAIGATFSDPVSGVVIKAVARGGTEPAQFLDVEVTLPSTPPDVVVAWGREGATFFNGNTGAPSSPVPETHVPLGLTGVRAIAAGGQHAIALKADGSVVAWGNSTNSQTSVPAGLTDVVAVAAGGEVSGVVRRDGSVRLWGSNASGQTTVPAELSNVAQLAIGTTHVLALKTDGTVTAWGSNTSAQTTIPAGLADVVAIAAGSGGSVAVRRDGTVVAWGAALFRAVPAGLANVVAISACGAGENGGTHVLALRRDRTVAAWGNNANGQSTVPAGLNGVVAVSAGGFHSLAMKSDGTVVAWGSSVSSQTNVPVALPRGFALASSTRGCFALAGTSVGINFRPQDQTIAVGGSVILRVDATGLGALGYQWRKDGVGVAGATSSTLALTGVTAAQSGLYDVVVTDSVGGVVSPSARLTVNAVVTQEVSRIANLSIRTRAGTGAQTLIVGFVVGGASTSGPKPLLVRGVGPTLGIFGVTGVLADPKLEVYSATAVKLFENDNWNPADAATFASVGAFALTANSSDAALYNGGLASAGYSAQLSGVGGATGVVLAELYDVTPATTFGAGTPRLINVSARAVSGVGADVLIAGFVIAGPGSKTVLVRAIGPTLSVFGVTGVLADPKLELFNGAGVKTQENDNWGTTVSGSTPVTAATFTSVGAFGLTGTSRDAALLATLQPGAYTVQVSGVGGTTGVALVEVYEAP